MQMSSYNSIEIQGLQETLQALSISAKSKFVIGLSGGLDSVVLLHMLASFIEPEQLTVVHVNHQLHEDAKKWVHFCQSLCVQYNLKLRVETVNIPKFKEDRPSDSLEALARQARYQALSKYVACKESILLTAHHADDQVETFFLQLMRGAGSKGLQSMPLVKPFAANVHVRPLLNMTRLQLEQYARQNNLEFVEDTSNADVNFDRNFIRHDLLPTLAQRWPNYLTSILTSVEHISLERKLLQSFLKKNYPKFYQAEPIKVTDILSVDNSLQPLLVRAWLATQCEILPPKVRLKEFLRQLAKVNSDSKHEMSWSKYTVTNYLSQLFVRESYFEKDKQSWDKLTDVTFTSQVELPEKFGRLEIQSSIENLNYRIKFREGGEKLRLLNNRFHSKLKNLFNQHHVLPWMRSRIPLIYAEDMLVAVANLWVNADWLEQQKISDFRVIWHNSPDIFAQKVEL